MSIIHSVTSTIQWMYGNKSYTLSASIHEPIHNVAYFMAALMCSDARRCTTAPCDIRHIDGTMSRADVGINKDGAMFISFGGTELKLTREEVDKYFLEPFQAHAPVLYGHGLVLNTDEGVDYGIFYDAGSDTEETWLVDNDGNILVLVETYDERKVVFDRAYYKGMVDEEALHHYGKEIEGIIIMYKTHLSHEE